LCQTELNRPRIRETIGADPSLPMHRPATLIALACAVALTTSSLALGSPPPDIDDAAPPTTEAPVIANPAPTPTQSPPPPCLDDSLTLTGRNLWAGLELATVRLTLRNGKSLQGTVVAQDQDKLAIARTGDGTVVAVPKHEIEAVNLVAIASSSEDQRELPPNSSRPIDDGRKVYGAGVGMLSIGVPIGFAGTVLLGIFPGAFYIHLPVLIPGIAFIVGGSIAIKRSRQHHDAYRKAWGLPKTAKLRLAPTLNVGRGGGELGLVMRF
jgi:hypothetical protein